MQSKYLNLKYNKGLLLFEFILINSLPNLLLFIYNFIYFWQLRFGYNQWSYLCPRYEYITDASLLLYSLKLSCSSRKNRNKLRRLENKKVFINVTTYKMIQCTLCNRSYFPLKYKTRVDTTEWTELNLKDKKHLHSIVVESCVCRYDVMCTCLIIFKLI